MSKLFFVCFFIGVGVVNAQDLFNKEISGKVSSADGDVAATHVLNITSDKFAITDIDGDFKIEAKLNDTLVFSAVQFKRKEIVVTTDILATKSIVIYVEPAMNVLEEIVVMPYNLSGDLSRDAQNGRPVIVASTLGLPNSFVTRKTKAERDYMQAKSGGFLSPTALLNMLTGRRKDTRERMIREQTYARTERVRDFYSEYAYKNELNIEEGKIDDFMYFCEVDPRFPGIVDTHDKIKIWEFLRNKSVLYRKNNNIETPEGFNITAADFKKE
ncbi:carboxypeptidase-like regulatory domain-containing protein [Cellulophaga sp. HaHaR_3_176]|uniref:carboxypeptidase-like regulatory domain-containing protein n=1 Tax=Cellulophaga sp. HaHaR_3_176 TaxID=1942464 RepID=UPI0020B175D9|nr:carboxypeptidase-like regulatory domain-containing protein [Cellulophaga sp. HaHaR_3_176]